MKLKKLFINISIFCVFLFLFVGCSKVDKPSTEVNSNYGNDSSFIDNVSGEPLADDNLPDSSFSIRFIDVGQADAALVECDGEYMLIDGGNKDDSSMIYSILRNEGVNRLKLCVASHAHEDHVGGLAGALNCADAEITLCPVTEYDSDAFRDFKKYADKNGGGIKVPAVGDIYTLGSSVVTILGVNSSFEDDNDTSIIMKIEYGDTAFLFTGDAEWDAEQMVLQSGCDLSSTVLKVGHHGSSSSTGYVFLREIMPEYRIVSVGKDNEYGHPADKVLSRLKDAGVTVFRTDLQGDILCVSDGHVVEIKPEFETAEDVYCATNKSLVEY